jgi:hypothetical protein
MINQHYLNAARDSLLFAFAALLLVILWEHNLTATLAIIGLFVIRSCFWREKGDLTVYLVGAVLGPLTEIIATRLGIWTYAHPSFLNIPFWRPFAWGFAAVLFVRIAQSLVPADSGQDNGA